MLIRLGPALLMRCLLAVLAIGGISSHVCAADRPSAPNLLPEQTLVYFRVANTPDLVQKFHLTSTGRMAKDEQLKPLLGHLWQMAVDAFARVEEEIEVPLNELLAIPQGEICFSIVAPEEGPPQLIAWIDCGDKILTVNKLLARAEQELANGGLTRATEVLDDVELVVHTRASGRRRSLAYFIKDQTLVISTHADLAKQMLAQWNGEEAEDVITLAENRKFTTVMSRSMGSKGEEPQVTWFLDPLEFARRIGRGNASFQTGLAIVAGLGLDGVKGIGGSLAFATEEFDGIFHTHLLLDSPRKGVIEALALQPGDVTPEPWVPAGIESYATMNWDLTKTYAEVTRLYDLFRGGEGSWEAQVLAPIHDRTGLDLEKDLLAGATGRFTMITWMEKPARLNSQSTLIGVKLVDADASRQVLAKLAERFPERMTKKSYGGTEYYESPLPQDPDERFDENIMRREIGCIAILDDYLLISNNPNLLQQAIITRSDGSRTLANELDYKIIASKIKRQLGDSQAGMIAFSRPEEGLRQLYELATSENMRGQLKTQAENNRFFKGLSDALDANPLPPFSVLAQYLAPSGALLTSDETGFHYMAFSLKREQ